MYTLSKAVNALSIVFVVLMLYGFNTLSFEKFLEEDERLTKRVLANYKKDAARLALRHLSNQNPYDKLPALLPRELVGSIYDALLAVHTSEVKEASIVTNKHRLHTFPIPSIDGFQVIYEKKAIWGIKEDTDDLQITNNEIGNLLESYQLKIDSHGEWDEEHNFFHVRTTEFINVAPILKAISSLRGVKLTSDLIPNGDGNDIELRKIEKDWLIDYIIKFDNCISGCKNKRTWRFRVSESGKVTFIKVFGEPLPSWMLDRN